jgi:hypothetical protein
MTPDGMREALSIHVRYEVNMMRSTLRQLALNSSGVETVGENALIESFCIHARNLLDFFDKKRSPSDGYVAARHFANSEYSPFQAGRPPNALRGKLSKQVARVTYDRSLDEQLRGPEIEQLCLLIEQEIVNFSKHLKRTYRTDWFTKPEPIVRYGLLTNETCTSLIASTMVVQVAVDTTKA